MDISDIDIEEATTDQLIRVLVYAVQEIHTQQQEILEKLDNLNLSEPTLQVFGDI